MTPIRAICARLYDRVQRPELPMSGRRRPEDLCVGLYASAAGRAAQFRLVTLSRAYLLLIFRGKAESPSPSHHVQRASSANPYSTGSAPPAWHSRSRLRRSIVYECNSIIATGPIILLQHPGSSIRQEPGSVFAP
jgi:hypothetical protein